LIAVLHLRPAKPRDVARAGVLALLLLRQRARGHQDERNDEKKSGHVLCLHTGNRNQRVLERRNTGRNAFVADAIAPAAMRERRENGKTPASHRRKRFF
jgi:hypothetical protein